MTKFATIVAALCMAAAARESAWAQVPTYETLARSPQSYTGSLVGFRGQVIQVMESGRNVVLRINITRQRQGHWADTAYVEYSRGSGGEERILDRDIVEFYGTFQGIKTYTTVLGSTLHIPHIAAQRLSRAAASSPSNMPKIIRGPGYIRGQSGGSTTED